MLFRSFAFLMTLLMLYAVLVQFNDPDSYFWIGLYGASVLASAFCVAGVAIQPLLWLLLGVYLAAVVWLSPAFPNTSLEAFAAVGMKGATEEMVRELWGMVICALWTTAMIYRGRRRRPRARDEDEANLVLEESWR
ncbi:transmembrane 220 family protein [Granulosicoccaceae sp. 1_MG-2023]|nr:transmembrane 220 family protein [Granulosicoccaceae sp. 1_MG-2023]